MGKASGKRARKVVLGVAAVGVATTVAGVAATQPASVSASLVDLAALIVVGSSTHPDGSGVEDFFQGKFNALPYNSGDDLVHVNFFTGPAGIESGAPGPLWRAQCDPGVGLGCRQRQFAAHATERPARSGPAVDRADP